MRVVLAIFLTTLVCTVQAVPCALDLYELPDERIEYLKKELNISWAEAREVGVAIVSSVCETRDLIEDIASHETSLRDKDYLIDFSDRIFSPDGRIYVSSLSQKNISSFPYKIYLKRLKSLSRGAYATVSLEFFPNFMKAGVIYKYKGVYRMSVENFQYFKGCKHDGMGCYEDITKKSFQVEIIPNKNKDPRGEVVRITSITADETYSTKEGLDIVNDQSK